MTNEDTDADLDIEQLKALRSVMGKDGRRTRADPGGPQRDGSELYRKYTPVVRRYLRSKVGLHVIGDLIQRIWLDVLRARSLPDRGFRTYILSFAHYALYCHYRELKRRDGQDLDDRVDSVESMEPSLSRQLSLQRRVELLDIVLRSLPLEYQDVLDLHYSQDCSTAEIAAILALEEGTVRSRLWRARQALKERLEELNISDSPPERPRPEARH
jgi:RNA polymerase sigma-70 factor (ECF subfamily)